MAVSSASVKGAAGSEEKGRTSPAGGGSLRVILSVLTAVVAVAVPILLLVHFHGHPMSQMWILSLCICSEVFLFLLFIRRSRWYYTEFTRLSYGPLLAFFSASAVGTAAATFVLLFSMAWAAGNLGYSLAVHRLRSVPSLAIHVATSPSFRPTKDSAKNFSVSLYVVLPMVVLLLTLFMALILHVGMATDELDILVALSFFGWINVAAWLIFVALRTMQGFPVVQKHIGLLLSGLPSCLLLSPAISIVSQIFSALFHLLLMLALVAFLSYNLAIYTHFLTTATPPSTVPRRKEDHLQGSNVPGDRIGQVKSSSDPELGTSSTSEAAAATLAAVPGSISDPATREAIARCQEGLAALAADLQLQRIRIGCIASDISDCLEAVNSGLQRMQPLFSPSRN